MPEEKIVQAESLPDNTLLRIERDYVLHMLKTIEKAKQDDFLWFGYKDNGSAVRPGDLQFFESGLDARQFAEQQNRAGELFQVLPLEATADIIRDQIFIQRKQGEEWSFVTIDIDQASHLQQQLNFFLSAHLMKQTMTEQHWKEMQPDHLESFLQDLKSMHDESVAGRSLVLTLVNEYWPDILTEQQLLLNQSNHYIMNEKNFDYLKDNLKYLGFGEKQHDVLEKNLKEGKDSFQLIFNAEVNKKPFEAVLNFRKSDNSDMYFFNSYHASLERNNGDKMEQTFYLNKGKGVTAKEAYNLLEGRPVFKELTNKQNEPYKAWIQLDFENKDKHNNHEVKQFHENYGYDLKAAVSKYAVKELDGADNEKKLLHSLEKGNIQSVSMDKAGTEVKMFIEANPQYKTVTLYDEHFKRVQKEDLGQYQSAQQFNGKEVKQSAAQEGKEVKEEQKQGKQVGKKNKEEGDDSLLPKKRNRQKKGMGLK